MSNPEWLNAGTTVTGTVTVNSSNGSFSLQGSGTGWSTNGSTLTLQPSSSQTMPVFYNLSFTSSTSFGSPFGEVWGPNSGWSVVLNSASLGAFNNLANGSTAEWVNMAIFLQGAQGVQTFPLLLQFQPPTPSPNNLGAVAQTAPSLSSGSALGGTVALTVTNGSLSLSGSGTGWSTNGTQLSLSPASGTTLPAIYSFTASPASPYVLSSPWWGQLNGLNPNVGLALNGSSSSLAFSINSSLSGNDIPLNLNLQLTNTQTGDSVTFDDPTIMFDPPS
jgi:hypothetical protein